MKPETKNHENDDVIYISRNSEWICVTLNISHQMTSENEAVYIQGGRKHVKRT